jgi:hypothetical protein
MYNNSKTNSITTISQNYSNKKLMKKAIENVASVKHLRFTESPIYELKSNSYTVSKTSSPIGIIFGFNSTTNFDTFES